MQTELEQVLSSISDLKTEFQELKKEVKTDINLFNTKFDYYQQATQWVIIMAFTLILAATGITIFSAVFAFR